jgi:hypothetical protein
LELKDDPSIPFYWLEAFLEGLIAFKFVISNLLFRLFVQGSDTNTTQVSYSTTNSNLWQIINCKNLTMKMSLNSTCNYITMPIKYTHSRNETKK